MIRLLLGLIKSDSGDCKLFGKNPKHDTAIWNDVGYLVETTHAYPNIYMSKNLEVIYKKRGLTEKTLINNVIDRLQLTRYSHIKEANLSLGNKQRLSKGVNA